MGTLTRSELVTEVHSFFANRTDVDSDRIITWLNLAQTRIARLKVWEELKELDTSLQTSASNKFLAEPSGIRTIFSLRLIDGAHSRKLIGKPADTFDSFIPNPARYAEGRPSIYTRWNGNFEFWKIPDDTYDLELRYSKWATAFNSSDDVVSDLNEKDDALIMLTVSWGHHSLRNNKDAGKYWGIYKDMINDAAKEDVENPDLPVMPEGVKPNIKLGGDYWNNPFISNVRGDL